MVPQFIVTILAFFIPLAIWAETPPPLVLVSVEPHRFFVEKVAGPLVQVQVMVPAGASAHTYEPTPKQMITAAQAALWFRMGEAFETKAISALKSHNSALQIVDLREGVHLIQPPEGQHCCKHHGNRDDLHFWLSAREAKIQAATIANALSARYPEHAITFQKRLADFQEELTALDQEIIALMQQPHIRLVLVSHPAYGYFCRDYGLEQLSIEYEGRDPTAKQLTDVLAKARTAKIQTVFIQMQYSSKGARLIADQLGAQVITLDPYSGDYMNAMRSIGHYFAEQRP